MALGKSGNYVPGWCTPMSNEDDPDRQSCRPGQSQRIRAGKVAVETYRQHAFFPPGVGSSDANAL
jgi:hypothetical protein